MAGNQDKEMTAFRETVDGIDHEIVRLFEQRMQLSREISDYKVAHNMAIYDPVREGQIVDAATALADKDLTGEVTLMMRTVMALSRAYQRKLTLHTETSEFLPPPKPRKTQNVRCVWQGSPGAWGEQAALKLFPDAALSHAEYFEDVFRQVKDGVADYGVLPIENSHTGAIGETYDLLRSYGCYIVGRTWIDVRQCLLAKPGMALKDVREVYSHPEGFRQCRRYLLDKPWDLIATSNTAVAAAKAASSEGAHTAAIGSRIAAAHNGLEILAADIMDSETNRTSFVVIASQPEYDAESDLISVSFAAAHRSGSLCEALLPFMAGGFDLTRIESRPTASPQSYRFFAELSGNIDDPKMRDSLTHAANATEYFEVIGCYRNT